MLDYWVTKGVVQPSKVYISTRARKVRFLFSFGDLVRLRTIRELRDAGFSLEKVNVAVTAMRDQRGTNWKASWLVSDGKTIFLRRDQTTLETLTGPRARQLAFAVVALKEARTEVRGRMASLNVQPVDFADLPGRITSYSLRAFGRR
jgi:DNA-binding transcriptional MerR regulator